MLKLFDTDRRFLFFLSNYKDYYIESELASADSLLYFTVPGKPGSIRNECYVQSKDAIYVVKEMHPAYDGTEVICQLDLEDLEAEVFDRFTAENCTVAEAANLALAGTGWTVQTDITKRRSVQTFRARPRQLLEKIRDAFMCEMRYDNINKVVTFSEEFGEYRGVYFLRDLNLKNLNTSIDTYDYYTRILPVGEDGLTIESVNDGVPYLENYQYTNKVKVFVWEDTSYSEAEALKEDARLKLNDLSKPKKSYSADILDLAKRSHLYDLLSFSLGDAVDLIDELSGIKDRQRIVKMKVYPNEPERNTCELSNTVLTFEELQDRLNKAADAWEEATNADGSIKGVYVHGIQAGDVVDIEVVINDTIDASDTINAISETANNNAQQINLISARVGTLETTTLKATDAEVLYAHISELTAVEADVHDLSADYATFKTATAGELAAAKADIDDLSANKANIADLNAANARIDNLGATYATIDLANVEAGSISSAMIGEGVVGTAHIADGSITDAKIVGLTASKITSGTIDAGVINVVNLTADNITAGTLNGQRIADGAISADKLDTELSETIDSAVADTQILYALSTSSSTAPSEGWSQTAPDWEEGKYMWQKIIQTLSDGTEVAKPATCISGAQGASGEDATILRIDSSRGTVFKNSNFGTVFTVVVWKGPLQITDITALRTEYGAAAYLEWKWRRVNDDEFKTISASDSRITRDGFQFEITPADVDEKIVFQCDLVI